MTSRADWSVSEAGWDVSSVGWDVSEGGWEISKAGWRAPETGWKTSKLVWIIFIPLRTSQTPSRVKKTHPRTARISPDTILHGVGAIHLQCGFGELIGGAGYIAFSFPPAATPQRFEGMISSPQAMRVLMDTFSFKSSLPLPCDGHTSGAEIFTSSPLF
ncbi:MAG: hypothetical protein RL088_3781 [Verrucomicrobiota bacterium]